MEEASTFRQFWPFEAPEIETDSLSFVD